MGNSMGTRTKIGMAVAAITLGLVSQSAKAVITNGDFETGDLTGYSKIGDVSAQGTDYNPPGGSNVGFLSTRTLAPTVSGTAASTNIASLDTASGLPAGTLEALSAHSGSVLTQTFFATAGDTVTFTYNYLTQEPVAGGNADQAFYTLRTPLSGTGVFNSLGNAATATTVPPANASQAGLFDFVGGVGRESGNTASTPIAIGTTGLYTITFGVFNAANDNVNSGLLVDNLAGATGNATGVPLPAAIFLAPLGVAVASRYSKKLRRKQA